MRTSAIIPILLLTTLLACKQNNKAIDEQQLLGTWETIEGFDFEEVSFNIEEDTKTINLVFGQRANLGTWKIDNGCLIIEGPYDTICFSEVQFSSDTLFLIQKNGQNSAFIRKNIEKCDASRMLLTLKDISKVEFSEVSDTIIEGGIKANYMLIQIEVNEDFSVLGKTIKPMVDELTNIGFELDNELITEIQTGYFHNSYKLIITNRYKSPLPNSEATQTEDDASGIYEVIIICYCN
ncbi:MAG TPA: hypothetical protein P5145_04710 [Tenuifilaceae bacterium]|nr:hypothetical protein [Tenuifilaceae bacterium]